MRLSCTISKINLNMFMVKATLLIAVALLALLWWLSLRRSPPPTCSQLFANAHKHIVPNAFDHRQETFVGVWASTNAREKETCSYYSFHKRQNYLMMGYEKPLGGQSKQYVAFSKGEDGVITYFPLHEPTNILGYIYPIFFDDYGPGIGTIECTDKIGFAEWKSSIAVPLPLIYHPTTHDMISQAIQTFQRLAPQLGVDIHLGDVYHKTCWKAPVWKL